MAWWNPASWAKDALHDAEHIESVVVKWVVAEGVKLGNLVAKYSEDLGRDISTGIGWVSADLISLGVKVAILADEVGGSVAGELGRLEGDLKTWALDAIHGAESAWDTTYRDVIEPAERWAHAAIDAIERYESDAWSAFKRDEWAPMLAEVHELDVLVHEAGHYLDLSVVDAVRLVELSWDWLEMFARNPLKSLESVPAEVLASMSPEWISSQAGAAQGLWGQMAAELDRVLSE